MMMSRPSLYYPRRLSEPAARWAQGRLWRLLIPVFMGVGQRLAGPFGPSLALAVMIVAHVATSPEGQHLAAARRSGLLPAPWLSPAPPGHALRSRRSKNPTADRDGQLDCHAAGHGGGAATAVLDAPGHGAIVRRGPSRAQGKAHRGRRADRPGRRQPHWSGLPGHAR